MVNSDCVTLKSGDNEVVAITKGTETILVCHYYNYVFIVSARLYIYGEWFVKYVRVYDLFSDAHDKFLKLLGKMILKKEDSKYFEDPVYEDHMKNGLNSHISDKQKYKVKELASKAHKLWEEYNSSEK